MNRANKNFYVGAFLAGSLGQLIIWEITQVLSMAYPQLRLIMPVLMLPANLLAIFSAVVIFILIYKMWAAIQGRHARTTAGKALGFMFIPFFNFYWYFQVYWGWTKDYNRIHESEDFQLPSMPEGIALAVCVLPILSMCLVFARLIVSGWKSFTEVAAVNVGLQVSILVGLVNTILMAILFNKICDGINALVDAGLAPVKPQYAVLAEDAKTSGRAIASLILGICGIFTCGLSAIAGLVLGIVSLRAIGKSQGGLKGTGLAIAGIGVSGTTLLTMLIMIAMTIPASINLVRNESMTAMSINNAKDISLAMLIYCDENDGNFPPVGNWPDALKPYIRNVKRLTSPFAPEAGRAWAMNKNLDGRKRHDIKLPHRTVLIYEARLDSPPAGGPESLPECPRGRRGYVIGFLDCHVECVKPERLDDLIWIPDAE
jgi:hypothetical protein